jgi:glycogen(starch) synthase
MSQALRVLMSADTVGGVWTYACELIAALRPLGVEVTLATMGAPLSPSQAHTLAAAPHLEVFESSFALEWMPDAWRDVDAAGEWLLALAQLTRPDVVHINGYSHAALPFGVPVVSVAHSCVCSWFRAVRRAEAGPEWDEYRQRARRGLRAASAVIAPTRAILGAILGALESDVRGRVISNGRSCEPRPAPKESFVLSAGRLWDEAKGVADLDACARSVTWPIRVAGSTVSPDGKEVTPTGVELLGELDPSTLGWWMSRAAIYALPARYEPFGLSVLEAAQAGCALVLGDIDSLREIWGSAALYVRPGDRDALAFTLNSLARDPLRCGVLSSAARTRARALTPLRMATAYQALYEELMTGIEDGTPGLDRREVHA